MPPLREDQPDKGVPIAGGATVKTGSRAVVAAPPFDPANEPGKSPALVLEVDAIADVDAVPLDGHLARSPQVVVRLVAEDAAPGRKRSGRTQLDRPRPSMR